MTRINFQNSDVAKLHLLSVRTRLQDFASKAPIAFPESLNNATTLAHTQHNSQNLAMPYCSWDVRQAIQSP